MSSEWPPNPRLPPDYNGPYPIWELQKARQVLINSLTSPQGEILERIKPKIGIPSRYGRGIVPPPCPTRRQDVVVGPPIQFRPDNLAMGQQLLAAQSIPVATVTRSESGFHDSDDSSFNSFNESGQGDGFQTPDSGTFTFNTSSLSPTFNNLRELTGQKSTDFPRGTESRTNNLVSLKAVDSSSSDNDKSMIPAFYSGMNHVMPDTSILGKRRSSDNSSDNTKRLKPIPSLSSPAASGSDHRSNSTVRVFQTYKCDFCLFATPEFHGMKNHLVNAKHFQVVSTMQAWSRVD